MTRTLQERISESNANLRTERDLEESKARTQAEQSESKRRHNLLATIIGCAEEDLPIGYLQQNPEIIINLDSLSRSSGSALAKADLRQRFAVVMSDHAEAKALAMAQEYRGVLLLDHNGNSSTMVIEHKQSTGSGNAIYPKTATYKSALPSIFQLKLTDFAGVAQSEWVDNIGHPKDCTLNAESSGVLFPDISGLSFNDDSTVEGLCAQLSLNYWYRPSGFVAVGLFNGDSLKQSSVMPFESLATAKTTVFNCAVEQGDHLRYLSGTLRDERDANKAIAAVTNGTTQDFKWLHDLRGVFL